jgi:hypothetical protein
MDADLLKRKVEYLISNEDIKKIFGEERIITYKSIDDYHNILDLLPLEKDYVILLIEWKPSDGHWVCITRNKNTLNYFDSYGVGVDKQILKNSNFMREHLEQEPNKLLKLLSTAPADFKIYYSKKKLQTTDDEIKVNVCGSYCILFIYMNLIKNYSIAKF